MLARTHWLDISVKNSGKRAVLVGNPTWRKSGYWSGKANSTLYEAPAVKYRPLIRRDRREALIKLVAAYLGQWQSSPWQFEGPARHQIRSHLVLLKHTWALADLEAAKIVETALRNLGHTQRPSWQEGQPESLLVSGQCLQCGRDLLPKAGRAASAFFCEEIRGRRSCREQYESHRETKFKASQTAEAQRVYREAFEKTRPPRPCPHCGSLFQKYGQTYCSQACSKAAMASKIRERACACCGTMFKPANTSSTGRYCSYQCSAKGRTTSTMQPCAHCQTPFKVHKSRPKKFCCVACYDAATGRRSKTP